MFDQAGDETARRHQFRRRFSAVLHHPFVSLTDILKISMTIKTYEIIPMWFYLGHISQHKLTISEILTS